MSYTDSGFDKRVRNLLAAFQQVAPPPPPPPPAPPTGMLLRLNAADVVVADGAPIDTWLDSSGNALDATAAGAQRPTFQAASAINGKPAVAFNSAVPQFFNLPVGFADFTAGFELFIVHSPLDLLAQACSLFGMSDNILSSAYSVVIDTSNEAVALIQVQGGVLAVGLPGVIAYAPQIYETRIPAGAAGSAIVATLLVNHVAVASGAANVPNNLARNLNFVGSDATPFAAQYPGVIAELILYDRVLTVLERAEMDAYLLDRYAL